MYARQTKPFMVQTYSVSSCLEFSRKLRMNAFLLEIVSFGLPVFEIKIVT